MTTIGYTTTEELQRLLKITTATAEQQAALERVLNSAWQEVVSEIYPLEDSEPLSAAEEQLAAEVQLERGIEHWAQAEAPFGILGIGDTGAVYTARDSWDRHALKLAPLKRSWGLA